MRYRLSILKTQNQKLSQQKVQKAFVLIQNLLRLNQQTVQDLIVQINNGKQTRHLECIVAGHQRQTSRPRKLLINPQIILIMSLIVKQMMRPQRL